ncbi:MAG: hypothetical protein EOP52_13470 [Sphingobacteriales bacterium]|nr:MAG: hypothetical protein EOP52_13470 [Sphingobacteriales bacterium]
MQPSGTEADATQTSGAGQPLVPSGTEDVAAPTPYPSAADTPVHDSGAPTPEQVTEAFDGLKAAPGNVLVKNLQTGGVGEVNEADARRLVAETPKDYQIV